MGAVGSSTNSAEDEETAAAEAEYEDAVARGGNLFDLNIADRLQILDQSIRDDLVDSSCTK